MTSFRRSNKSHKVPNVKLRPAPSSSSRSRRTISHDSGFESEYEASYVDACPRPFRGVVLCATGVNDKTTIFKQAIELGAQPLQDLTDKVTHLLATEPGSAKYKCAINYKLPIIHPSWITDSYELWLRGDDIDIEESVKTYRLPTFSGVVLCISGMEDDAKRIEINRLVRSEGGEYVKDITRPVRVTHLLCSSGIAEGSEKVRYAQRFNKNGEASIQIVWEEWFWDSLKVKGCCDEDTYSVEKPRPVRHPTPEPDCAQQQQFPLVAADKKSASQPPRDDDVLYNGEEDGPILVARLPAVTVQAWEGMLKSRGFERRGSNFYPSQTHAPRTESDPDPPPNFAPLEPAAPPALTRHVAERGIQDRQKSVLASFRRTHSFAPLTKDTSTQRQPQPFRRAATLQDAACFAVPKTSDTTVESHQAPSLASISRSSILSVAAAPDKQQEQATPDRSKQKRNLFSGLTFRAVGEMQCVNVRKALEEVGGRLVSEDSDENVDFVVVRLVSGSKVYREEAEQQERAKYRTECWLERCINETRICAPEEHVLFVPLDVQTPIPGAESVILSYSGLSEEEVCWVINRLVKALGFKLAKSFSRHSTHLLCPSRSGAKFEKAQQWGVPVVDMSWLTDVATTGVIASTSAQTPHAGPDTVELTREPDNQAKIKRQDQDHPTVDITNNDVPSAEHPLQLQSWSPPRFDSPLGDDDYVVPLKPNGLLGLDHSAVEPPELPEAIIQPTQPTTETPRQLSLAEIREDMKTTRIPSSASPSPMKMPSKSPSPVKLDQKAAVGLFDSINSLVKRPSEEDQNTDRRPKRARPASRTTTIAEVKAPSAPSSPVPPDAKKPVFDPFPHDEASQLARAGVPENTSMQITYEDPAQSTEKQRLMNLLEAKIKKSPQEVWEVDSQSQSSGSSRGRTKKNQRKGKVATRRSTRVSHIGT